MPVFLWVGASELIHLREGFERRSMFRSVERNASRCLARAEWLTRREAKENPSLRTKQSALCRFFVWTSFLVFYFAAREKRWDIGGWRKKHLGFSLWCGVKNSPGRAPRNRGWFRGLNGDFLSPVLSSGSVIFPQSPMEFGALTSEPFGPNNRKQELLFFLHSPHFFSPFFFSFLLALHSFHFNTNKYKGQFCFFYHI